MLISGIGSISTGMLFMKFEENNYSDMVNEYNNDLNIKIGNVK
jgi:hypothetical protein